MISEGSVVPLRLMFNLLDRSYEGVYGGITPILDNLASNIFDGGLKMSQGINMQDGDAAVSFFLRLGFFIFERAKRAQNLVGKCQSTVLNNSYMNLRYLS